MTAACSRPIRATGATRRGSSCPRSASTWRGSAAGRRGCWSALPDRDLLIAGSLRRRRRRVRGATRIVRRGRLRWRPRADRSPPVRAGRARGTSSCRTPADHGPHDPRRDRRGLWRRNSDAQPTGRAQCADRPDEGGAARGVPEPGGRRPRAGDHPHRGRPGVLRRPGPARTPGARCGAPRRRGPRALQPDHRGDACPPQADRRRDQWCGGRRRRLAGDGVRHPDRLGGGQLRARVRARRPRARQWRDVVPAPARRHHPGRGARAPRRSRVRRRIRFGSASSAASCRPISSPRRRDPSLPASPPGRHAPLR